MQTPIELLVGDTMVEGQIIDSTDGVLHVELIEPYGNLTISCGLTVAEYDNDRDGTEQRTRELLDQLYAIACYVQDNRTILVDILSRIFNRLGLLSAEAIDNKTLVSARQRLQEQLSSGEIDTPQYHSRLEELEERNRAFQQQLKAEIERFFETAFPMTVPEDCRDQVLGMMARRSAEE